MHSSLKSYIIGFILSIVLVVGAYIPVYIHVASNHQVLEHTTIIPIILILAVVQAIVQLRFFLHLGTKSGAGWNLPVLLSALGIMLLLVVGSIWIMDHLNHNMTPDQINQYMQDQGAF